jgi:hypothetical protein
MITKDQYEEALNQGKEANKIISQYHTEQQQLFDEKVKNGHKWTDEELIYSARKLCPCGHGLAYPRGCGGLHYWDCSAILKGVADPSIEHCAKYPFAYYDIKGESDRNGTTRGVYLPKQAD